MEQISFAKYTECRWRVYSIIYSEHKEKTTHRVIPASSRGIVGGGRTKKRGSRTGKGGDCDMADDRSKESEQDDGETV